MLTSLKTLNPPVRLKQLLFLLLIVSSHPSTAQDIEAEKLLTNQGYYFLSIRDNYHASQVWNKLILLNSKDENALYGLGVIAVNQNKISLANQYLSQLKGINPKSLLATQLQQEIQLSSPSSQKLITNARLANEAENPEKAVQLFKQALGDMEPQGQIALEYYNLLAKTENGRTSAIEGLSRLSQESPSDMRIQLQYAKQLITKESTRANGLELLFKISKDKLYAVEVNELIRSALVWATVAPTNLFPYYQQFLKANPDDAEVKAAYTAGLNNQRRSFGTTDIRQTPEFLETNKNLQAAKAAKDPIAIDQALRGMLQFLPNDPWLRLDLANNYLLLKKNAESSAIMEELIAAQPKNAEAIFAYSIYQSSIGNWRKSLSVIEEIAPKSRTPEMAVFQKSAWIHAQAEYSKELFESNKTAQANSLLLKVEQQLDKDEPGTVTLVNAYNEIGETKRALNLIRKRISENKTPSNDLLISYSNILLATNQSIECFGVLQQLKTRSLTQNQKIAFDETTFNYSIKQAELMSKIPSKSKNAVNLLEQLKVNNADSVFLQETLARAYSNVENYPKSQAIFQLLVENDPQRSSLYPELASVAIQNKNLTLANQTIETYLKLEKDNPEAFYNVSKLYRMMGKGYRAQYYAEKSVELSQNLPDPTKPVSGFVGGAAPMTLGTMPEKYLKDFAAVKPALAKTKPKTTAAPVVEEAVLVGNTSYDFQLPAPTKLPTSVDSPSQKLAYSKRISQNELNDIKQERSTEVLVGTIFRGRNGDPGKSAMKDAQLPIEIRFPIDDAKFNVKISPVNLNVGTLQNSIYSLSTFGGGPDAALAQINGQVAPNGDQIARGVGLSAGASQNGFSVDAGVTPLGFLFSKFTGGIKYEGNLDNQNSNFVALNASIRPVTDSILSFAGMTDSRTGETWGGVTSTGGRAGFTHLFGNDKQYGYFINGAYHQLTGTNVDSNTRKELTTGVFKTISQTANSSFKLGLSASGIGFDKDLSYYTIGHGGYFSPQSFITLSVPFTFEKQGYDFRYSLQGAVGWHQFSQDGNVFFPTDAARQSQAVATMANNPLIFGNNTAVYPGSTQSGVSYNLYAASEYQVAPQFFLGGILLLDNSGNYRQWSAGMSLKYTFENMTRALTLPVNPLLSPYSPLAQ